MIISFEVHGKVQRVFFRKYTKKAADELGICGWVSVKMLEQLFILPLGREHKEGHGYWGSIRARR